MHTGHLRMLQRVLDELSDISQNRVNAAQVSIGHPPWHCIQRLLLSQWHVWQIEHCMISRNTSGTVQTNHALPAQLLMLNLNQSATRMQMKEQANLQLGEIKRGQESSLILG